MHRQAWRVVLVVKCFLVWLTIKRVSYNLLKLNTKQTLDENFTDWWKVRKNVLSGHLLASYSQSYPQNLWTKLIGWFWCSAVIIPFPYSEFVHSLLVAPYRVHYFSSLLNFNEIFLVRVIDSAVWMRLFAVFPQSYPQDEPKRWMTSSQIPCRSPR